MRIAIPFAALVVVAFAIEPICAFAHEDKTPDLQSIEALVAKASEAKPRDQCFLYAQAVHQMTELSVRQYASGNVTTAKRLLKQIQTAVEKINLSLGKDAKRLKRAQILLSKTAFRLTQMLHATNYEDRPLVRETLAQVNEAQNETMLQVFRK